MNVQFEDVVSQIASVYEINAKTISDVYDSFSLQLTSHALNNDGWPNVIMPNYEAHAAHAIQQTGARSIGFATIVKPDERAEWEQYSRDNQGWKQKSFDYYDGNTRVATPVTNITAGSLFRPSESTSVQPGRDVYMPLAQFAPLEIGEVTINFDMLKLGFFPPVYDRMVRVKAAILSEVRNLDPVEGDYQFPESILVVPVFKDMKQRGEIVGVLSSALSWKNYFLNLMPEGLGTVALVITNTCNQTQSYLIDGPVVNYLGPDDFHDDQYDKYGIDASFNPFASEMECVHTLHFYPTEDFEDPFRDSKPIKYTIGAIAIFAVTAFVFIIYDCLVENRQTKVLTTAEKSSAIVSSLFPANVRDRLMDDADAVGGNTTMRSSFKSGESSSKGGGILSELRPKSMNNNNGLMDRIDAKSLGGIAQLASSPPIADLFPSASVLFADLVNFTKWSSCHEPTEVFALLETIYNSFDRMARRRNVFKVETIGDCYVAATGLPEQMPDHATVLANFAVDCTRKMPQLLNQVVKTLGGDDTLNLSIRIGIHSGPVTAGVLRGEKSRFQLFGDTVNTAARMESTGKSGCIHVSQATANLIIEHDLSGSLDITPRNELVEAKGKGSMQTFWVAKKS